MSIKPLYAAGATGSGLSAGARAVKDRLDRTRNGEWGGGAWGDDD